MGILQRDLFMGMYRPIDLNPALKEDEAMCKANIGWATMAMRRRDYRVAKIHLDEAQKYLAILRGEGGE